LGKKLMDAIVGHPALVRVEHFELYCRPELIPFYERWGFKEAGRSAAVPAARLKHFHVFSVFNGLPGFRESQHRSGKARRFAGFG